jgi:hypothetical protein
MGTVAVVSIQPGIHNRREFFYAHRLVMIIQTRFLECADEPLHKRLFLEGLLPGPVLPYAFLRKIILGIPHVLDPVVVDYVLSKTPPVFFQAAFAFRLEGLEATFITASLVNGSMAQKA